MITALLVMTGIALVLGAALGYAAIRFKVEGDPLVEKIDAILPQTPDIVEALVELGEY